MRAPTYKLPYRTKLIVSAAKSKGSREVVYIDHDPKKANFPVHVEYAHTGCENFFEWAHVELAKHDETDLWGHGDPKTEYQGYGDAATGPAPDSDLVHREGFDAQLAKDKAMIKPIIEAAAADKIPSEGYPDNNPKTMLGVSKCPLHLVPPIVEAQMAMAWKDGAAKYGPFNWRKEKISSSVYYAAAKRHMLAWYDGEDKASDSGVHHLAHAMACLGMVLDGQTMGKLNDDRPPPGAVAEFLEECIEKN